MKNRMLFPLNPKSYSYAMRLNLGWQEVVLVLAEWGAVAIGAALMVQGDFHGGLHLFMIAFLSHRASQYRWAWRTARAVLRDAWRSRPPVRPVGPDDVR